jgi:hypothetical protein
MTWYADEIICRATPEALAAIAAEPSLSAHAYHVTSLDDFSWYRPEFRHSLPDGGLLVLRPVCGAESHGAEWHGTPILDWNSLPLEPSARFEPDPAVTARLTEYLDGDSLPPMKFRQAVAEISSRIGARAVYYACAMWGGDIDYEYSLMYGPTESVSITNPGLQPDRDGVQDSLRVGLSFIGLDLPASFFLLHTRDFPWPDYKLT